MVLVKPLVGPTASLKLPRIVDSESELFYFAISNNVEGLKGLFNGHMASPLDIESDTGFSALQVRALYSGV